MAQAMHFSSSSIKALSSSKAEDDDDDQMVSCDKEDDDEEEEDDDNSKATSSSAAATGNNRRLLRRMSTAPAPRWDGGNASMMVSATPRTVYVSKCPFLYLLYLGTGFDRNMVLLPHYQIDLSRCVL